MSYGPVSTSSERVRSVAPARAHTRWGAWGRSAFVVAVVLVLAALGIANVVMRARYHEVEDGVSWGGRPQGVVALEVAASSPAEASGILPGDVLLAVNGVPIE